MATLLQRLFDPALPPIRVLNPPATHKPATLPMAMFPLQAAAADALPIGQTPIAILFVPVVIQVPTKHPIVTFAVPVVMHDPAHHPIETLQLPLVVPRPAKRPIAMLSKPVTGPARLHNVQSPMAMLKQPVVMPHPLKLPIATLFVPEVIDLPDKFPISTLQTAPVERAQPALAPRAVFKQVPAPV
jgi:hypothetical protein